MFYAMSCPRSMLGALVVLIACLFSVAARGQSDFDPGSVVLTTSQEFPTFLTFDQLNLDGELCPTSFGGPLGAATGESLAPTDPEAIRVYLDLQDKPHGGGDDGPIANIGSLRPDSGSGGDTCGSPRELFSDFLKLCLVSVDTITTACGEWKLEVSLDPLFPQPVQLWNVTNTGNGGFFVTDVTLALMLTFTHTIDNRVIILRRTLVVRGGGDWARQAGPGGFESPGNFEIDTDCDCFGDREVMGTTNFFPGWRVPVGPPGLMDTQEIEPAPFCLTNYEGGGQLCFAPVMAPEEKR
ncbi:MAG: hypothetical protein K0U98_04780 [Deltaproteobacteria bacterium]|nr:hypothetical protein [Deltaproteobacteria bacterium]